MFIYIKIPESVGPLDRGSKYEDPLDLRLTEAGVGNVSGGGSQLGDERPDGTRLIEFCGIDVDTSDLSRALDVVRRELLGLKAPEGTQIHYTQRGIRLQDELRPTGWLVAQPRSFLHPGFGC